MLYVTTSWDDGDALDVRVADILDRYGAKGTFYITKEYRKNRLNESQIKDLAQRHEIGAHTLTHPNLPVLSREEKQKEIRGSKEWLEDMLGKEVSMFCYPFGAYDEETIEVAKEAGFTAARTVVSGNTDLPTRAYEIPTTLHIYPFPLRKTHEGGYYWRYLFEPFFQRAGGYRKLGVSPFHMTSWLSAAKAAFDHAYKRGGVFHLWSHSWELEDYDMWEDFEKLLVYIATHTEVRFVTNMELFTAAKLPTVDVHISKEKLGAENAWTAALPLSAESVVYSFGAGEDVSWDVALVEKYNLTVHAFDPTPRSIAWVRKQTLPKGFIFHEVGIGNVDGLKTFMPPMKTHHVSYSPTPRKGVGEAIEVPVKRLSTLMQELGHAHIDVLKIDIEGGEYEVLADILASNLSISQILVEFHHRFKEVGVEKTKETIAALRSSGYKIFDISTTGEEYSFIRA